jgi:hypothetical protein
MEILPKTEISKGADEAPDVTMLGGMEKPSGQSSLTAETYLTLADRFAPRNLAQA